MMKVFGRFFCSRYQLKKPMKIVVLTDLNLDETQKSARVLHFDELCDLMILVTGWKFKSPNQGQTRF